MTKSGEYDAFHVKEAVDQMKAKISSMAEELLDAQINIATLKAIATNAQPELPAATATDALPTQPHFEMLPGTPYSQYAIPLEYQPSRDLQPRWGSLRPPIPQLLTWFKEHTADYTALFGLMREKAGNLANIPLDFDEANLPLPAWRGVPYCPFDAVTLYTVIQKYRPKRYLEIGSGVTTCYAYKSIRDAGLDTMITSIDPQPRAKIDSICDHIIRDGLETCDLSIFDTLEANDVLFFDGSHRSFMNSDVTVFFIDILPRLKPGVIVHIHDIPLPWDYDNGFTNWYWNEAYMLAVLSNGP